MASNLGFVEFVCDRMEGLGDVRFRKMFGDYVVYLNEKPVILICDNVAYVKILPETEALLGDARRGKPYEGARDHYVLDVEQEDPLREVCRVLERVLPFPKRRSRKKSPVGQ